ncbi:MAG: hypothetical protein EZS28_037217, partial [Streblomastix strix]
YTGFNGYVYFKGNGTSGNKGFMDGQLLSMELNCNAGTLHFFVDSKQQRVFVRGINEPVKFFFELWQKGSSFAITPVKCLDFPTVKTLPKSEAVQW